MILHLYLPLTFFPNLFPFSLKPDQNLLTVQSIYTFQHTMNAVRKERNYYKLIERNCKYNEKDI